MTPIHCTLCGKDEKMQFHEEVMQETRQRERCFDCNFWLNKYIARATDPEYARRVVIVEVRGKREHFTMADEEPGTPRGHGGAPFHIKFHDGRDVVSRNLWCQGDIPPHLHAQFPINAAFVE